MASSMGLGSKALNAGSSAVAPNTRANKPAPRSSHVSQAAPGQKTQKGRWKGMDAGNDVSDDQQDIRRGRGMVDELFQGWAGSGGTQNAIMSSQDYISTAQRSLGNIEDGFYISPAFLDKLSIHIAKNFMNLPKIKVPLILGIWGGKGQGKTFQCMLAFKKLGITPIVMSAGELESGNAGEPAKLIRQRYREASDQIKKGKMCALFINDLDAGAGRFGMSTQYTVNNQMVNATLMNIADNPTNVQLPGVYKNEEIPRVPIICTGNDFSTLYAPLIRDGRMEKYYWNPTREDRIGVCMGIFMDDNLNRGEVEQIVDAFPGQSIDFFGALRARVYDDKVREFVISIGHENLNKRLVNSKEGKVVFEKPKMGMEVLMAYGKALVQEQDNVKRVQLADAYLGGAELAGSTGSSVPEQYEGAKGLKIDSVPSRSWRATPAEEAPRAAAPAPSRESYSPPTPAPAAPASGDRWSRPAAPAAPQRSAGAAAGGSRSLSAGDLAVFKIADLAEIARKRGVSGGRDATRQSLTDALVKAGVSTSDLSKGQLAELSSGGSSYASIPASSPAPAAAAAAPAASSGGDRWASYSRGSSSSGGSAAPAARSGSGTLSAGDLSSFKITDLVEIAGKRGVSAGRNATRESLTDGLVKAGVSLEDLSRGQLVDLATKLGKAGLSRDLATARSELASLIGGSGSATATWRATPTPKASSGYSSSSSQAPPASWRSSGSSSSSSSGAAAGGDRWAKYSTGSAGAAASGGSAVWRKSGSHNASGSKLSAGDLAALRIDDLRDLVKKTGAQLPREPTKDGVISGLVSKGVSLNDLTRGMLVDLSNKLGAPLGRDVDSMRKNLAGVVGKSGGYSPAANSGSGSSSSWRTPAAAAPAASSSSGDRWASYSRSSGSSNGTGGAAASAGGNVSERELGNLKIDTLSELARKKGISMRNATKQDLISQLARVLKHSDLSKGQAAEIAAAAAAPAGGRRW